MSYDLDAAVREAKGERFTFSLGGKEFSLPHQTDVDKNFLAVADSEGGAAVLESLKIALGDQWAAFDAIALSVDGVDMLFREWNKHSGVESGE
jgi:hypothetical protein